MKTVIAICENENCGCIFASQNLMNIGGKSRIGFQGAKLGPCPDCGGYGKIPDGIYQIVDDSLALIRGPKESVDILKEIQSLLLKFEAQPVEREKIIEAVQNISPTFADKLKEFKNASLHTWLQTVLAIIAVLISIHQTYLKDDEDDVKDKIILELIKKQDEKPKQNITNITNITIKIQRNDLCPCKSGLKYKKCCLVKK